MTLDTVRGWTERPVPFAQYRAIISTLRYERIDTKVLFGVVMVFDKMALVLFHEEEIIAFQCASKRASTGSPKSILVAKSKTGLILGLYLSVFVREN
jgi:hypothetical protein